MNKVKLELRRIVNKNFKKRISLLKIAYSFLILLIILTGPANADKKQSPIVPSIKQGVKNPFITPPVKEKKEKNVPHFFKGVRKEVLDNGLTIITLEQKNFPIVAINIFINTGSINEDERTTGISHFCEHLFYRGTRKRTGIELKKRIEELGGVFNAETSKDMTRYHLTVPPDSGLEALEVYCDATINASYDPESIEKERKVILEEYNLTRQNPAVIIRDKLYSLAYSSHPYKKSIIGTADSIKSFSREDFLEYKQNYYSPEKITVVVVGNFDRSKIVKYLKDIFAGIPGGTPYRSNHYVCKPLECNKEVFEPGDFDSSRSFFVMAFRSPGIQTQKDVLAMDMLIFMLGSGKNSIFHRELSKKQKLVDDMSADYLTSRDPGLVMFSTQVKPEKVKPLKDAVLGIVKNMKEGNFTEEEMKKARNLLLKTYIYGNETCDGKADALGFYETLYSMDFALNYVDRINKLTKEDIVEAANKYFGENYILYVMEPRKRGKIRE